MRRLLVGLLSLLLAAAVAPAAPHSIGDPVGDLYRIWAAEPSELYVAGADVVVVEYGIV